VDCCQHEERLDDCLLIVVIRSLAAGRRSLQAGHAWGESRRAWRQVRRDGPEQGLRVGGRGGRGLNFRRREVGGFGAGFAVSPDEPTCDAGACRSDQSDAHDHDDCGDHMALSRDGVVAVAHGGGDDGPPDRVAEMVMVAPVGLYSTPYMKKALTNITAITMLTIGPA
jgi:hypothetical protein